MNFKLVLKTYSHLRQLSDDETALLNALREMNDAERELLVESLSPQPQKKPGKKSATKSGNKSARASGMAAQLNTQLGQRRQERTTASDDDNNHCAYELSYGPCEKAADDNIHHLSNHPNYHEFQPGKSSVPDVGKRSSASGAADGSGASSETGKGAAGVVAHGVSRGAD